jgi:hypothetical protein
LLLDLLIVQHGTVNVQKALKKLMILLIDFFYNNVRMCRHSKASKGQELLSNFFLLFSLV